MDEKGGLEPNAYNSSSHCLGGNTIVVPALSEYSRPKLFIWGHVLVFCCAFRMSLVEFWSVTISKAS